VALALTEDSHIFERYGMIMPPEDKDAALFPHRIRGHWATTEHRGQRQFREPSQHCKNREFCGAKE
jgi:predicted GH43/DUF377 family glycosyl hydrolase